MGAVLELAGQVVGDLTVVGPTERRDAQGNIVWSARCKCGCEQLRSAAYLRAAIVDGRRCGCPRCLRERRIDKANGRAENRVASMLNAVERLDPGALGSSSRTQSWLRVVLDWYGLYGLAYDLREEDAIRSECSVALGAPGYREALEVIPCAETEADSGDESGQLWSNLYPMRAPEDHGYLCMACGQTRELGWGCTECICFVCYDCGVAESHRCSEAPESWGGATYERIGRDLDVSRERVRQIEGKAFRKIEWVVRQSAGAARARRLGARVALMSRFPNSALRERLAEMRQEQARAQYDAAQREREAVDRIERERRERESERPWQKRIGGSIAITLSDQLRQREIALARDRAREAERCWRNRIAESMAVMLQLKNELWRQVAVHAVGGDMSRLPWSLRYPSIQARFGNSTTTADSAEGMFSCARCRLIMIDRSPEAMAHARGDCTFVFAPPQWVVHAVLSALNLGPVDSADSTR